MPPSKSSINNATVRSLRTTLSSKHGMLKEISA